MKHLLILFLIFCGSAFSYFDHWDLIAKTTQKEIQQKVTLSEEEVLYAMTDGSLWIGPVEQSLQKKINIENFNAPQSGQLYTWVWGYESGDSYFEEVRTQYRLIMLEGFGDFDPMPYTTHMENLKVVEVLNNNGIEILIINNSTIILMPSHHQGNGIGDEITIHIMKNGTTAYLERHLDTDGQTILIPMSRNSSYSFTAH